MLIHYIAAIVIVLLLCAPAAAQTLPTGPARAFDGRLVAAGEVTATVGEADESAFFNYTDYEYNALRMVRLSVTAAWRPVDRLALVGEVRSENFSDVRTYAAFVRVRPWRNRTFDIQAGRIPPTFGAFGRRAYGADNPLIGYPLAYQYLTSLRTDAVPASVEDLLRMRGRGWRTSFQVGSYYEGPGLPLVSAFRWDFGVQARWETGPLEVAGAVTTGTLSNPRFTDDNGGRQLAGRIVLRPMTGLVLGASAARGAWLSHAVSEYLPGGDYHQRAVGADVEYSRDHWVVRSELVWSGWDLPYIGSARQTDVVSALAAHVEGRYRITPRIFVAARADRLGFSRVQDEALQWLPWDAPVRRGEIAAGYYFQRNLVGRVAVQRNVRLGGGRVRHRTYVAGQLMFWF